MTGGTMTQVLYGDHISKGAELRIGSCAVIFDETRKRVLLTQRTDNGLWCLPGGKMESGETLEECCQREVFEETGLEVRTKRLIGIYSNRDQLIVYRDGNKVQIAVLSFEAEIIGGELGLSDETTAFGYFSLDEIESMPMHGRHKERVIDALKNEIIPILKS
jgi:8-oxo-dGTP pyrophosphatase MutT (NUDIX family)